MHRSTSALLYVALILSLAACGGDDPWFAANTTRAEVYRVMGKPSNTDDASVAVWTFDPKRSGVPWRTIFKDGKDAYFAVFDGRGMSLLPRLSFSASTVEADMSEMEIIDWARQLNREGWGQ